MRSEEREQLMQKFDDITNGINRCPKCSGTKNKIVDRTNYRYTGSRIGRFGTHSYYYYDAERECSECGARFTTGECSER